MLPKLIFISQGTTKEEQLFGIQLALDSGVKFIQIRWKDSPSAHLFNLIQTVAQLKEKYNVLLTINDHLHIAKDLTIDGLHLGLDDDSIKYAREQLGSTKIIGGTANTFTHIKQRTIEHCDYIGLGPYRFTKTKKALSPILGIQGYRAIIDQIDLKQTPPIFAVGGIRLEDIHELRRIGVYGVAASTSILKTPNHVSSINHLLNEELENSK